jgi:hypothetical protein
VPALQARSPEFKPQICKKKNYIFQCLLQLQLCECVLANKMYADVYCGISGTVAVMPTIWPKVSMEN